MYADASVPDDSAPVARDVARCGVGYEMGAGGTESVGGLNYNRCRDHTAHRDAFLVDGLVERFRVAFEGGVYRHPIEGSGLSVLEIVAHVRRGHQSNLLAEVVDQFCQGPSEIEALVEAEVTQTNRQKLDVGSPGEQKRDLNFEGVLPPVGIFVESGVGITLNQKAGEFNVHRLFAER